MIILLLFIVRLSYAVPLNRRLGLDLKFYNTRHNDTKEEERLFSFCHKFRSADEDQSL